MALYRYVDLTGLGHFKDKILVDAIIESGTGANITETNKAPSISATYNYVQGEISDVIEQMNTALGSKLSEVKYDSTNKKITAKNGTTKDVVTVDTIRSDMATFGASGSNHKKGLVPDPGSTAGTSKFLREDATWAVVSTTDTKNTAGATDTSSKIYIIGATSQDANPQTYSQDTAYVGTDGCLYSDNQKVLTQHQDISGKADKATTLAGYGITDAKIANGVITLGANTITPLTSHQDISGKANVSESGYSLSVSGTSVSLKNKEGTVLSTITTQDTNTTYESKSAASGGTDVSLVTTGEKYTWNNKTSNTGTITSVTIKATSPIAIDSESAITTSGTRTISHANSGATAGSYGDSSAQTPSFGDTFKVPYVTVNATGHVAGISEHTVKIPDAPSPKDDMIGTVMWWSGSISSIPSNAKICNGQSLSSTTYATLYARIGTTYGGDSDNFALPDLRIGTSTTNGRFIRAGFTDASRNAKQDDAIRNITGTFYGVNNGSYSGAFSNSGYSNIMRSGNGIGAMYYTFSANNGGGKGTATDSDGGIRPYNISLIPIIIVS